MENFHAMGSVGRGLLPDGPWLDRLDPQFWSARFPELVPAGASFDQAAGAFRRDGFLLLAPLGPGLAFDAAYFREINPAWEACGDLDCYRQWLLEGCALGQHAAPAAHLASLNLPLKAYPDGFHWAYYAQLRPQAGAHRWSALEDFCRHGFATWVDDFPFSAEAFEFLLALGQRFSVGHDALAVRAYERAQTYAELPILARQHLADAYLRLSHWRPSSRLYASIINEQQPNSWTIRNFVKCTARLGSWGELFDGLKAARPVLSADPLWYTVLGEAMASIFDARMREARARLANGEAALAEAAIAATVEELTALVPSLQPPPLPASPDVATRVLLVAKQADGEGTDRYVTEKQALLQMLGLPHVLADVEAAAEQIPALDGVQAIILYRAPAIPAVIQLISAARSRGIPVIYETDTKLGPQAAPPLASFRGRIDSALYGELRLGLWLDEAAASLSDAVLAPTPALSRELRDLAGQAPGFTLPNSLLPCSSQATMPLNAGRLAMFLRAPELMFIDAAPRSVGASLMTILQRWPEAMLYIDGPVHLDQTFDIYSSKICHNGNSARPVDYWPCLAACAINLAIRCGDAHEAYRTELSWAEAAACGIPSVLLVPDGELPAIRDEVNALRAATPDAWTRATERLLNDPLLRERLGLQARADVARLQGREEAAAALLNILQAVAACPPRAG